MSEKDAVTIEEALDTGQTSPDSNDPDYLAWKKAKIKTSVRHADTHPDDYRTHKQVFDRIKKKFRP